VCQNTPVGIGACRADFKHTVVCRHSDLTCRDAHQSHVIFRCRFARTSCFVVKPTQGGSDRSNAQSSRRGANSTFLDLPRLGSWDRGWLFRLITRRRFKLHLREGMKRVCWRSFKIATSLWRRVRASNSCRALPNQKAKVERSIINPPGINLGFGDTCSMIGVLRGIIAGR